LQELLGRHACLGIINQHMYKILAFCLSLMLFSCSSEPNEPVSSTGNNPVIPHSDSLTANSEAAAVFFKVTDEEALRVVSKIPEVEYELKRAYKDTTVKNMLVLIQEASPEDRNHYVQLMEMHGDRGTALIHFRVDANTSEIKVMDPLAEEELWITLDKWRQIKL
jgi:hypothetical protein